MLKPVLLIALATLYILSDPPGLLSPDFLPCWPALRHVVLLDISELLMY